MNRYLSVNLACLTLLLLCGAAPASDPAAQIINRFATTWEHLRSYTCTWTVLEVQGSRTQYRVYHIFFQKPLETRAEVVDGDGKGSVAIWNGGDRVRGHRGGILSIFKLNLDINSPLALTLRGGTIAQVNMGWLLQHIQTIGSREFTVSRQGADYMLSASVHEPAPNDDVLREVYVFDPNGLPLEGFQYGVNDLLLKHVVFSDCHLDVALPPSTWQI